MTPNKDLQLFNTIFNRVWSSELASVFKDRSLLEKVLVLVFDNSFLYVFSKKSLELKNPQKFFRGYFFYKIKHNLLIKDIDLCGWWGGIKNKGFLSYLPHSLVKESQLVWPRISGPTPSVFINCQQKIKENDRPLNPYITKHGYMATVVHEFGHAYYDSIIPTWHGIKDQNLKNLTNTLALLSKKNVNIKKIDSNLFLPRLNSEIYAFCTEYYSASKFWPDHKRRIERELKYYLPQIIEEEKNKDLNYDSSFFDSNIHLAAASLGIQIIAKYHSFWPRFFF